MLTLSGHDVAAGEVDDTEVDRVEFVIADVDAAEAFEPAEEPFDEIARPVSGAVQRALPGCVPVRMRRRDQFPPMFSGAVSGRPPFIGAVGDQLWSTRLAPVPFDQRSSPRRITRLSWRQRQVQRQPVIAHDHMQLGRQSPTRAADRLPPLFLGAPAAYWWTFMIVLSR